MENLSHESDEEESISQAKRVNSSIMMNEYKDNEIDTELITSEKDSAYKESHFYALLLFMNILNGVFREKQDLRNTFEKINCFSQFRKMNEIITQQNEKFNFQTSEMPSVLSNTIRENLKKGLEGQDDNEINEIMKMFGQYTESKHQMLSDDKKFSSIGRDNSREGVHNYNAKAVEEVKHVSTETQTALMLVEEQFNDESGWYPAFSTSFKRIRDIRYEEKPETADACVQAEPVSLDHLELKLIEKKVSKAENKFDKIFILIDEIAHKMPNCSKIMLEIRRELEVEIGALELEKRELSNKRKELFEKSEALTEIEIRNFENNIYLENKLQELNIRLAEIQKCDTSKISEFKNVDVQTTLTVHDLRESEVDLISSKKNIEIDLMMLSERMKSKERDMKFDYDCQRKEIEVQKQELSNENKILISKKKQLLLSPFGELKSEFTMRELISFFKSASIQDVKAPEIDIEFEEYLRKEMFQISTLEDIDKLRKTSERVIKLEYILLKEKAKMHLVSQYVDAEINELEAEKEEYRVMRQKYENLVSMERDLQRYRDEYEEKSNKFNSLMIDFKEKVIKVFDNFQEIIQVKKEIEHASKNDLSLKTSKAGEPNTNHSLSLNDQLNKSLEDIDTIIEIQKTLIQNIPECDDNRLLKNLKDQWTAYQYSSISSQSLLAINNK